VYIDGVVRQVDADILLIAQGKPGCADMSVTSGQAESSKEEKSRIDEPKTSKTDEKDLQSKGEKVCILVPVTSRKQDWKRLEDTFLYKMPLSSLAKTCEPEKFSYTVFVGYDAGDAFFDNPTTLTSIEQWMKANMPFASLATRLFVNELRKPGPIMNFLSREAYNDKCDFIYRINDDTELLTPWTSAFVNALRGFKPPLRGVVGPTCNEGQVSILTHDFVHRSHLDIFPTHYPPELTDWWLDDWITNVYGDQNTRKLGEVVVKHHVLATRYEVRWESEKVLKTLLTQGRLKIARLASLAVQTRTYR
jgi:hypothetical protein